MERNIPPLDLKTLRNAYRSGHWTPSLLVEALNAAIEDAEPSGIWISRTPVEELLEYARRAESIGIESQPLYGVPFAIKDNIDLKGLPTTAGCPEYAYEPETSAFVVQLLLDAGAIPIGKTNLDQFATGLVGVRSPYGFPSNAYDAEYIPGGSSSGSAIAVARGFVTFALGTDTAGSGRVPAAFNNIVGVKPSRGLLSCSGVVPACKSLDCVTVFANNASDATSVTRCATRFDPSDAYARKALRSPSGNWSENRKFRFGVPNPEQLRFFGNDSATERFFASVDRLEEIGGERIEVEFEPFVLAARLLYEGPWVAERFAAIEDILLKRPQILHPITRRIIEAGEDLRAVDAYRAQYRLMELKRLTDSAWETVDLIVTPTAGTIYKSAEVEDDPVQLNTNLGYYTNFMNLLDYSAIAVPAGFLDSGLPFGITLFAPSFEDENLSAMAARFLNETNVAQNGANRPNWSKIVVCGAHMSGLPLNCQLTDRGGELVSKTRTAAKYKFYALPQETDIPPRPGLIRTAEGGASIAVEVWRIPTSRFGDFVEQIPAPLGIGKIELENCDMVSGFLCEQAATSEAEEITNLGDWRKYLLAQS